MPDKANEMDYQLTPDGAEETEEFFTTKVDDYFDLLGDEQWLQEIEDLMEPSEPPPLKWRLDDKGNAEVIEELPW